MLLENAPAKVNLTLRVLGRRADGYHEIESLVAFAEIGDTVEMEAGSGQPLEITGPFADFCGPAADNLIVKALAELRRRIPEVQAGTFRLEKRLPVAAGLGGGSADAAAALRLLARINKIAPHDSRLASAALAIGADVPVCRDPSPRVMRGIGELLSAPVRLASMPAVLVNPRVPLSTRDVFAQHRAGGESRKLPQIPDDPDALLELLNGHENELTAAAIACAPIVGEVLAELNGMEGVRLARMSGSGPTCFAILRSYEAAVGAAESLLKRRSNWWVCATHIG